jgi:GMP synthase (glutamine-hydrolysing)
MSAHETVAIVDFGSQYSQLIARRVRDCHVYCELVRPDIAPERLAALNPSAYILSGGPSSVYDEGAPRTPPFVWESGKPVLAICYGMHLAAHELGGEVVPAERREYGHAVVEQAGDAPIFRGLPPSFPVWMSHGDSVAAMPPGFAAIAHSQNSHIAAMASDRVVALQFHPEVVHTRHGTDIIENFLFRMARLHGDWTPGALVDDAVAYIRDKVGDGRAICGLSGGVDSAVAAALTHRAIGDRLTCVFVDHGLLRLGEAEQVVRTFREALGFSLVVANVADRFLERLAGIVDPEEKRRRIGHEFVRVFEHEAQRLSASVGQFDYLVQGTLYPDVIESAGASTKTAQTIKTHHNVGGLPENMEFDIVEPLRHLFKDEVRAIGATLGLPDELTWRHPFPGPGLAIRILGEVTRERLDTLRLADDIFIAELRAADHYRQCSQALAVLTPLQTVGVMGDGRTYANVVALRAVTTDDFMTADWARLPHELLARASSRIVNEVPGINRVVYDISSKPPATIEWE